MDSNKPEGGMDMEVYKSKLTHEYYILIYKDADEYGRFLNIDDKDMYTIPFTDMDLWISNYDLFNHLIQEK